MAHEFPTTEPTELTAGTSWGWDAVYSDHPASAGWTLTYIFNGPTTFEVTADADGDAFRVRVPAATTAAKAAGPYRVVGRVTDGTDAFDVFDGRIFVRPNLATTDLGLSHAETVLAAIKARLEGRITRDQEEVTINGTAVKKIPMEQLMKLRGVYADQVKAERNPGRFGQRVEVRFGSPR